jgi:phosphate transport system substrate-binding protein
MLTKNRAPLRRAAAAAVATLTIALATHGRGAHAAELAGTVKIDGSSTVFPITEAMAEEFQKANPKVRVTAGVSGTGGGYKRFVVGETDLNDASRPITADEAAKAASHKIEFIELPIAYDGITVVVNPKNAFVKALTKEQLKKLWEPGSKVATWKDLDPSWPADKIKLYGPGADSGTFDYFTEEIVGKAKASRSDYTASEDDNTLVNGVAGDLNGLGYFGYAYYVENKTKLKAVGVDGGKGAKAPDDKSIEDGSYALARPIFIVVNKTAAQRPEVDAFVRFYLANAKEIVKSVGYTPLPAALLDDSVKRYEAKKTGAWQKSSH